MENNKHHSAKETKLTNHNKKPVDFVDYNSKTLMNYLTKKLPPQERIKMTKVIQAYPIYKPELEALRLMLADYDDNIDEVLNYTDSFEINIAQCIDEIEEENEEGNLEWCMEEDLEEDLKEESLIAELFSLIQSDIETIDNVISSNENETIDNVISSNKNESSEKQKPKQNTNTEIDAINDLKQHLGLEQTYQNYQKNIESLEQELLRLNSSPSYPKKPSTANDWFKSKEMRTLSSVHSSSLFLDQKATIPIETTALICQQLGEQLTEYKSARVTEVKSFLIKETEKLYLNKLRCLKLKRSQGSNISQLLLFPDREAMENIVAYFSPYFDIIESYCSPKMDNSEMIDWSFISTFFIQVGEELALLEDDRSTNNTKIVEITTKVWGMNKKKNGWCHSALISNPSTILAQGLSSIY